MLQCAGDHCPLKQTCYRYTYPFQGRRDTFVHTPYCFTKNTCAHFVSNTPSDELIQLTAYYIWLREGQPDGCAEQHWREAHDSLARSTGKIP